VANKNSVAIATLANEIFTVLGTGIGTTISGFADIKKKN
jgi:hypothetical protein